MIIDKLIFNDSYGKLIINKEDKNQDYMRKDSNSYRISIFYRLVNRDLNNKNVLNFQKYYI